MEKLEAYRSWLSRPIKKLLVKNHMTPYGEKVDPFCRNGAFKCKWWFENSENWDF